MGFHTNTPIYMRVRPWNLAALFRPPTHRAHTRRERLRRGFGTGRDASADKLPQRSVPGACGPALARACRSAAAKERSDIPHATATSPPGGRRAKHGSQRLKLCAPMCHLKVGASQAPGLRDGSRVTAASSACAASLSFEACAHCQHQLQRLARERPLSLCGAANIPCATCSSSRSGRPAANADPPLTLQACCATQHELPSHGSATRRLHTMVGNGAGET